MRPSALLAASGAAAVVAFLVLKRLKHTGLPASEMQPIPASMAAVVARDGRCVLDDSVPAPKMGDNDVMIKVVVTAINRLDCNQRAGKLPVPPGVTEVLGLEVAGVIVGKGKAVGTAYALGDEVLALVPGGGYGEFVSVDVVTVMRKPKSMPWEVAGSIPEAWLTAYKLVHVVGKVQAGEVVLIHAAASGVGIAAIQLVVAAGATAIATVGSREKLELCVKLGAIGGAVRHDGPWLDRVTELAKSKGGKVHLVLDPVASNYAKQNLEVMGIDGRWVLYSLLSGPALPDDLGKTFLAQLARKRISLLATTLRTRPRAFKAALVDAFTRDVLPKIGRDGGFSHLIDRTFHGLNEAQTAHELMETNANSGKIVLRL